MRKTLAILTAAAFLSAAPVLAFEGKKGHGPDKKIEHLKERLALTDVQADQVRAIFEATRVKIDALLEDTRTQIKAVLTPEQQAKYDAMKKEWDERQQAMQEKRKELKQAEAPKV